MWKLWRSTNGDVDRSRGQLLGGLKAAEPGADDDDVGALAHRIRVRRGLRCHGHPGGELGHAVQGRGPRPRTLRLAVLRPGHDVAMARPRRRSAWPQGGRGWPPDHRSPPPVTGTVRANPANIHRCRRPVEQARIGTERGVDTEAGANVDPTQVLLREHAAVHRRQDGQLGDQGGADVAGGEDGPGPSGARPDARSQPARSR